MVTQRRHRAESLHGAIARRARRAKSRANLVENRLRPAGRAGRARHARARSSWREMDEVPGGQEIQTRKQAPSAAAPRKAYKRTFRSICLLPAARPCSDVSTVSASAAAFTPDGRRPDSTMKPRAVATPSSSIWRCRTTQPECSWCSPPRGLPGGIRRVASGVPAAAGCTGVPSPRGSLLHQPRPPLARTAIPPASNMTDRYFMTVSWMRMTAHPERSKSMTTGR